MAAGSTSGAGFERAGPATLRGQLRTLRADGPAESERGGWKASNGAGLDRLRIWRIPAERVGWAVAGVTCAGVAARARGRAEGAHLPRRRLELTTSL